MKAIDINNELFYEYGKPEKEARTKARLTEMKEIGMEECGLGSFGYKRIMSGLYIEIVWSYTDEKFKSYLDWVRELIKEKEG